MMPPPQIKKKCYFLQKKIVLNPGGRARMDKGKDA